VSHTTGLIVDVVLVTVVTFVILTAMSLTAIPLPIEPTFVEFPLVKSIVYNASFAAVLETKYAVFVLVV